MDEENWIEHLARDAYSAYGATTGFKNYEGKPMPAWSALPSKIQEAWKAATRRTKLAVENNFRPKNAGRVL